MWPLAECAQVHTLAGHRASVTSVCVTPDGKHVVTCSDDETARVWRLDDGSHVRTPKLGAQRRLPARARIRVEACAFTRVLVQARAPRPRGAASLRA
eukprot:6185069-Pleurochrysis_carterae.AAC.2